MHRKDAQSKCEESPYGYMLPSGFLQLCFPTMHIFCHHAVALHSLFKGQKRKKFLTRVERGTVKVKRQIQLTKIS